MEGNIDVSSASTLEAQPIGETRGEREATFEYVMYSNRIPHFSYLSLITHSRSVCLMYLVIVSGAGREILKW